MRRLKVLDHQTREYLGESIGEAELYRPGDLTVYRSKPTEGFITKVCAIVGIGDDHILARIELTQAEKDQVIAIAEERRQREEAIAKEDADWEDEDG